MSNQPVRPLQQQGTAPTYGGPNQYLGQRPAMSHLQQASQRPASQAMPQGSQPWAGPSNLPGLYTGLALRPQQAPDGRLSDLLTNQTARAVNPAISTAQPARPFAPVSTQQTQYMQQVRPTGQPAYSTPQQLQQQGYAAQPSRVPTPTGQPTPQYANVAYRPQTSGGQPMYSAAQLAYQQPAQIAQQQQLQRGAQPGIPPRPALGQAPAGNMYQQAARPGYHPPSSAAIAQQYQAIVSSLRPQYGMQPGQYSQVPQLSEEDRRVLPKKSLKRKAVAATGDVDVDMDAALQNALVQVADDFITSAVAFGCGLAKRRKSTKLQAADVAAYLERSWQLRVPGFSAPQVKPYRRPAAKDLHQARTAVMRKEILVASEKAEKAKKAEADAEAKALQNSEVQFLPD